MRSIRNPKDFYAGLIYIVFAAAGILIGRNYSFGTAGRMGPGYFPVVLSFVLLAFGVASVVRSFIQPGDPVGGLAWKPILLVLGATALFGALIETAGLPIAMIVLVLMSAAASTKFRFEWGAALGLIGLVVFCSLVFVKGLGVPMPLLGSWFGG